MSRSDIPLTSNLVAELRAALNEPVIRGNHHSLFRKAADEIERLTKHHETGVVQAWKCGVCEHLNEMDLKDCNECNHPRGSSLKTKPAQTDGEPV